MSSSPAPDPLSSTLQAWGVAPHRNPRFRSDVQARLASTTGPGWIQYARQHAGAVVAALVLALTAGAVGGWGTAKARANAERDQLARAYVQELDARTMRMP